MYDAGDMLYRREKASGRTRQEGHKCFDGEHSSGVHREDQNMASERNMLSKQFTCICRMTARTPSFFASAAFRLHHITADHATFASRRKVDEIYMIEPGIGRRTCRYLVSRDKVITLT